MLRKALERQGNLLFHWRSYLPLPLLLLLLVRGLLYPPQSQGVLAHWSWDVFCLGIGSVGWGIRLWVGGYVPAGTSGRHTRTQVAHHLNTTGPYSVMRHPLYLGNFFMWMGVALLTRSAAWVLLSAAIFWICYERIMIAEERFLRKEFGEEVNAWATTTPAVLPAWGRWRAPKLRFSWRTALRREYSGMFGFVAAMGILELVGDFARHQTLVLDPLWRIILLSAAAAYLLLRTLKRRTRLLHVPGR